MKVLIVGTPDSGKSRRAEELITSFGAENRYYIATMIPFGEEGAERVARHRAMRADRGFVTLELPTGIESAVSMMEDPAETDVLLECVSNLTGNLLYAPGAKQPGTLTEEDMCLLADEIAGRVMRLADQVRNLVAVTNTYAPETSYDAETLQYIRVLDLANERLSAWADRVDRIRKGAWTIEDI